MALDPPLKALLDKIAAAPRMDWRSGVGALRAEFWRTAQKLEADAPAVRDIVALEVQGAAHPLKARLYVPYAAGAGDGACLVYFHGGGFILGDLDSHEMLCRRLAAASRVRVLSVAYRLAPEHRFPAAADDAAAATRWAIEHAAALSLDPGRIAVGGDSAGGNLAAVVAQDFKRAHGPRLLGQMLFYPCVQLVQMTPSQIRLKEGYYLTQAAQDFFKAKYLANPENARDVRASPLLADDLSHLPPAYVLTAGYDPLLDEGKAYADRLAAAGVDVTYAPYANQIHGFLNMTAVSSVARSAIEAAAAWLARRAANAAP
ncbi:MAG: alpha/beta hydrolase [Hyphomonadaceae bacterium]|nr:alpha/beta hydrolase [Hyphomonadaceae bacterium]